MTAPPPPTPFTFSYLTSPTYLAGAVGGTLDLILWLFGGWGRDPGRLLKLGLQHGLLALTAQISWVDGLQVLSGEMGRTATCPDQLHLPTDGPLPEVSSNETHQD